MRYNDVGNTFGGKALQYLNNESGTINNTSATSGNETTESKPPAISGSETTESKPPIISGSETPAISGSETTTDTSVANLQTLHSMQAKNNEAFTAEFNDFKNSNNMPDLTLDKLSKTPDLYNKFLTKYNKIENIKQSNITSNKSDVTSLNQQPNNSSITVKNDNADVVNALNETNKLLKKQNEISENRQDKNRVIVANRSNFANTK